MWSLYLLLFFVCHALKASFELRYYLCKKSVCQMVFEISGVKVACALCTNKYSIRGALGRYDGEVIRVK